VFIFTGFFTGHSFYLFKKKKKKVAERAQRAASEERMQRE